MAFADVQFPPRISFGAQGGPVWQTSIARVYSGREYRNRTQSVPLSRFDVSHAGKRTNDWEAVRDFFYNMGGRATAFRFKDWTDYRATVAQGVFIMLTSTTFQMAKRYAVGAITFDRPIYKPIASTFASVGGVSATLDATTGIVTVSSGTPTAWAGQFDIPARFDIDQLPTQIVDKSRDGGFIYSVDSVPIQEVRDIA
jgi:uncharacterized protein (TIGR02217 family)